MKEKLFRGKRKDDGSWICGYLYCAGGCAYIWYKKPSGRMFLRTVIPETIERLPDDTRMLRCVDDTDEW